jgi:hypothetical protein
MMINKFAAAALALALGSAALVAPAAAQSVSINVGSDRDRGYHEDRRVERRVERRVVREREPVRVVRRDRCSSKTVITHRGGERIVRKIRNCG